MRRIAVLILVPLCTSSVFGSRPANADDSRAVYETQIDAGIDDVWRAFTTSKGLQSWMAPIVDIDLTIGGKLKSNYNADGELGDASTIESTILSYDPKRMISLKATKFPEGFPFVDAAKNTWSIFYFTELSPARTKITVVGLGYTDERQSQQMREFFAPANERSLNQLNDILKTEQDRSN